MGERGLEHHPGCFAGSIQTHELLSKEWLVGLRENCWTTELPEFPRTPPLHACCPAGNPVATLDSGIHTQAHFLNAQVVGFLELR